MRLFTPPVSSNVLLQPRPGVDDGPIHLVQAGLINQLTELGWKVLFDGHHQFEEIQTKDDPPIGKLKNPRLVSRVTQSVADVVSNHAKKRELPVTLGGDHSLVRNQPCQDRKIARFHAMYRLWVPFPGR